MESGLYKLIITLALSVRKACNYAFFSADIFLCLITGFLAINPPGS